jgi:hypothetical protein
MLGQSQQLDLKHVLQVSILLAGLAASSAFAADYTRLAQSGRSANSLPSQPTKLSQTATSCQINCETSAMNCINNCGLVSGQPELFVSAACLQARLLGSSLIVERVQPEIFLYTAECKGGINDKTR